MNSSRFSFLPISPSNSKYVTPLYFAALAAVGHVKRFYKTELCSFHRFVLSLWAHFLTYLLYSPFCRDVWDKPAKYAVLFCLCKMFIVCFKKQISVDVSYGSYFSSVCLRTKYIWILTQITPVTGIFWNVCCRIITFGYSEIFPE